MRDVAGDLILPSIPVYDAIMPRLRLPAANKRSCPVIVALTPGEFDALEDIKRQTGRTRSDILRDAFIAMTTRRTAAPPKKKSA